MSVSIVDYNGQFESAASSAFTLIDNYIYLYHTSTLIILPTFPESIQDNVSSTYSTTDIMGRSAPIFSYSHSGPRTVDVSLKLHRDMMNQVNLNSDMYNNLNIGMNRLIFDSKTLDTLRRHDYMDLMIKQLESIAFPNYAASQKMVNPPMVALRIGDEIFCKGIVDGGVSVNYNGPILANQLYDANGKPLVLEYTTDNATRYERYTGKGKYAMADISFKVTEVDPYSADLVAQQGSFRGINRTLEHNLFKVSV